MTLTLPKLIGDVTVRESCFIDSFRVGLPY